MTCGGYNEFNDKIVIKMFHVKRDDFSSEQELIASYVVQSHIIIH